jgi:hypothetical protein
MLLEKKSSDDSKKSEKIYMDIEPTFIAIPENLKHTRKNYNLLKLA